LTGKILEIKNFFVKLERGVKYYRFLLSSKNNYNIDFFFFILDFIVNTLFFLISERFFKMYNVDNVYVFKLLDLEFFSNIRLANNFYTSKLNDIMYLYFFMDKDYIFSLEKILKQFKLII
jgi:hypothetical protein